MAQSEDPTATARTSRARMGVALSLAGLSIAELARLYGAGTWAGMTSGGFLLAFIAFGQPLFGLRERYLLGLGIAVTLAAAWLSPDFGGLVFEAVDRATFLAAFMVLLALLRDGAVTSNAVLAFGRYLTRQPPARRYVAIQSGGHALGIVLNFGALSLLGPLIQRGLREGADASESHLLAIRERRQMSALARGFSWIIVWSPTAVSQALIPTVIAGVDHGRMVMLGLGVAVAVLIAGWLEDGVRGVFARRALSAAGHGRPVAHPPPFPARDVARFAAVCLSLATASAAVMLATGVPTIAALMLVAPVVTAVWVWLQNRPNAGGGAATRARLRGILCDSVPRGSPEALTLSVAGYIGIVAAGLADARAVADAIGLASMPAWTICLAAAAIVPLASNLAMPPILVVTFLGSLYSALPDPPVEPTVIALSFALGWALNLTASPFGATGLILARITGIPATVITWRWNGTFTVLAYAISAATLVVLTLP